MEMNQIYLTLKLKGDCVQNPKIGVLYTENRLVISNGRKNGQMIGMQKLWIHVNHDATVQMPNRSNKRVRRINLAVLGDNL